MPHLISPYTIRTPISCLVSHSLSSRPAHVQGTAALRSALEGQAEERRRCGETGALMVQQRELAKRVARIEHRRPDPVACRLPQILGARVGASGRQSQMLG